MGSLDRIKIGVLSHSTYSGWCQPRTTKEGPTMNGGQSVRTAITPIIKFSGRKSGSSCHSYLLISFSGRAFRTVMVVDIKANSWTFFLSSFKPLPQNIEEPKTLVMASIGSLVFCTDCGNLLPPSKGVVNNILSCDCCGALNKGKANLHARCRMVLADTNPRTSCEDSGYDHKALRLPIPPATKATIQRADNRQKQPPDRSKNKGDMPRVRQGGGQVLTSPASWCR
jgi:DNA-directed RNA polymerase subunit M/transcription elongation factor TFIIS